MTPKTAAFGNRKSAVWTDEGNDPLNGRRRKVYEMSETDDDIRDAVEDQLTFDPGGVTVKGRGLR